MIVQSGKGETTLPADIVLVATGVRPNSELAQAAGLKLGATGAIWVDAQMRTSDPHIYAAGGSADPEALYTAFRGRMPSVDAMLKGRGLAVHSEREM